MSSNKKVFRLVLAAMFLALALVLPLLTGQIPKVGNALCLIHIPVLLCGFFCGPWYGLAVGAAAPVLRSFLFGVPPLFPKGVAMCLELATYGLVSGLMYRILPKKKYSVYIALITAMLAGRIVWGLARMVLFRIGLGGQDVFGWAAFVAGGFVTALPGIVLHIVLIPVIVMLAEKYTCRE